MTWLSAARLPGRKAPDARRELRGDDGPRRSGRRLRRRLRESGHRRPDAWIHFDSMGACANRTPPIECPLKEVKVNTFCPQANGVCEYGKSPDELCNTRYVCVNDSSYGLAWVEQSAPKCELACPDPSLIVDKTPCDVGATRGPRSSSIARHLAGICACTMGRDGAHVHEREWRCTKPADDCPPNRLLAGQTCGRARMRLRVVRIQARQSTICADEVWQPSRGHATTEGLSHDLPRRRRRRRSSSRATSTATATLRQLRRQACSWIIGELGTSTFFTSAGACGRRSRAQCVTTARPANGRSTQIHRHRNARGSDFYDWEVVDASKVCATERPAMLASETPTAVARCRTRARSFVNIRKAPAAARRSIRTHRVLS